MKEYKFLTRIGLAGTSMLSTESKTLECEVNGFAKQGWRVVSCSLVGDLYISLLLILEKDS